MKLSILIPTIEPRKEMRLALVDSLLDQIEECKAESQVEVITLDEAGSIGHKRNRLLEMANGEYVCFIDDDDTVSKNYIANLLTGIILERDCCSLRGVITWDGSNHEIFEHSLKYSEYKTTDNYVKYERYPNHLNCIKASIAKKFKFPEINHGEDTDWATQIFKSGLIKDEYYIPEVIYHYQFITNK